MNTTRALLAGLVTAAALLTACGGERQAATEDTPTTTTTTSSTAASTSSGPAGSESPETTSSAADEGDGGGAGIAPGEPDPNGSDPELGASCGDVDGANGKVDVFAEDTPTGRVGCVEAINVVTEYFAKAPAKGVGDEYALTVDGWTCVTDTGAEGSGNVACEKDGLAFHTRP
ncbi:MAG TPA: hypothetical protein VH969_13795 [Actinophytocola sp.]|uniref:hypothetical protein n=1 Tax=Actinophytocola sp. TaxID=1872138 RepID=UPI002F93C38B